MFGAQLYKQRHNTGSNTNSACDEYADWPWVRSSVGTWNWWGGVVGKIKRKKAKKERCERRMFHRCAETVLEGKLTHVLMDVARSSPLLVPCAGCVEGSCKLFCRKSVLCLFCEAFATLLAWLWGSCWGFQSIVVLLLLAVVLILIFLLLFLFLLLLLLHSSSSPSLVYRCAIASRVILNLIINSCCLFHRYFALRQRISLVNTTSFGIEALCDHKFVVSLLFFSLAGIAGRE